ncbi:nucleotide pyrophosphohydrolase [Sphingobacterium haloxyli]|nr:nucleotide pyrophosphohydrolase [Sphingobacterium haloxyli]
MICLSFIVFRIKFVNLAIKSFLKHTMTDIEQLLQQIRNFRDARDWQQFHNSKDLSVALSIEASELLELFLWKGNEEADPQKLKEELADVLMYTLLLADKHGLDIKQIIEDKIKRNNEKYPVDKAKGTAATFKIL